MRTVHVCAVLVTLVAVTGCGSVDDRQWMKINQKYTTAEFQRDYTECSPKKTLDEDCMRSRGWVEVSRSRTDRDSDPRPTEQRARPRSGTSFGGGGTLR
jgi:hypothetical protein